MRSTVIRALGTSAVAIAAAVLVGRARLAQVTERRRARLLADARLDTDRVYTRDDLRGLPDPVRRYLDAVLEEGQRYVGAVHHSQRGQFRLGDAESPWKPLVATQTHAVDPPGFVWDARIDLFPLLPVRVVDAYEDGEGSLDAKLLSVVPVASSEPSRELSAGELSRYLAEAVWFPTAFLPGQGVEWEPIDDASARATLSHRGTTVSLIFHFDDRDLVDRVVAEDRYRAVDGEYEPTKWTGRFWNYQRRNGMSIPVDGEVAWNLPGGDLPYWRASIESITHLTGR